MFWFEYTTRLLLVSMLPMTITAAPDVSINTIYYNVSGATADEVWTDIIAKSPVRQHGKQHVAYTRWHVNWKFWWLDRGDRCEISKVETSLDVTYTLPRLEQDSPIPEQLLTSWQTYYTALFEHEQGHRDFGIEAAEEIENSISAMGDRDDCKRLEHAANEIGHSVISKYSRIEKEYDLSTNHGLNTGAVFP
jgi:predicted secreted Zn-dependent protease